MNAADWEGLLPVTERLLRRVRKNHALEHATIAVLMERHGVTPPLAGCSTPGGYFIYGDVSTETLDAAATEALRRLRDGEHDLAISPFCGTNVAVGATLTSLVTAISLGRRPGLGRLTAAINRSAMALLITPVLGRWLQRHATTLADVADLEVASVSPVWFTWGRVHRVRTRVQS